MAIKKAPHRDFIETAATRLRDKMIAKAWKELRKTKEWETYRQAREEAENVYKEAK